MNKNKFLLCLILLGIICSSIYFINIYSRTDNAVKVTKQQERVVIDKIVSVTGWKWVKDTKLLASEIISRFNAEEYLLKAEEVPPLPNDALSYNGADSLVETIKNTFTSQIVDYDYDVEKDIWNILIITDKEQHTFNFIHSKENGGYLHYSYINKTTDTP